MPMPTTISASLITPHTTTAPPSSTTRRRFRLKHDASSYYSNLGTAYFGKKQFEKAIQMLCQSGADSIPMSSNTARTPEFRPSFHHPKTAPTTIMFSPSYYARTGVTDRSLHYLKKAMEEGYKDIKDVYKDNEF